MGLSEPTEPANPHFLKYYPVNWKQQKAIFPSLPGSDCPFWSRIISNTMNILSWM